MLPVHKSHFPLGDIVASNPQGIWAYADSLSFMRTPAGDLRASFISYPGTNNYSFPCYYLAITVYLYLNLNMYIFLLSHIIIAL